MTYLTAAVAGCVRTRMHWDEMDWQRREGLQPAR